jgi:hypothetical protein
LPSPKPPWTRVKIVSLPPHEAVSDRAHMWCDFIWERRINLGLDPQWEAYLTVVSETASLMVGPALWDRSLYRVHLSSARARCSMLAEVAPSPTAAATLLMLPARTSPTANTPGRLLSSMWGGRDDGQRAFPSRSTLDCRSRPVRMKPLSSRARRPCSQLVFGEAPDPGSSATASARLPAHAWLMRSEIREQQEPMVLWWAPP